MTTLTQLADRAQNALSDSAASIWSQALIEEYCNAAIRDYSVHFPRTIDATIATSADDRKYDLPAGFQAMLTVEYPSGNDPPDYLVRRDHRRADFWDDVGYYDIVSRADAGDVDELYISEKPTAAQTIAYEYKADHDYTLVSGGTVTVPVGHEHILIACVVWLCYRELMSTEMQSPTSGSALLMGQMDQNTRGAFRDYQRLITEVKRREIAARVIKWDTGVWGEAY